MNAGIADRRRTHHFRDPTGSTHETAPSALPRRRGNARPLRGARIALGLALGLAALLALCMGEARAQDAAMLDERVTQQSVGETICRPGYADTVAPPFDELMARKDRLLAARGIDADNGVAFALDRRVPIVLGGSPDAPSNLDLLPWAGQQGERRKARAAVMLKRCVCEGKLSLAEAQAAIVGNWSVVYSGFSQTSCDVSRLDVATGGDNGRSGGRDNPP
ncbi:hypothetical protein DR64_7293 [Paraburkholderia xenovorans LB400]|uniref:Uncharacterized protein n=1 Tax=Paraburkholderia xenovorans (strain LB400) TaxID=266265 RepID=Q13PJ6_PARXL|nr:hypothetical protein [Paraburkholderia xenovorans]ABE33993.1 hypothetical protein Bxe_B1992 [Paraburkholderia xenovorans LB400]AIP36250.1 hypothetical protein DR64_7293 [Paraburkholderia xenovorans LB400]